MSTTWNEIIVQTFVQNGEESHNLIRLRPYPGQGYSSDVRVSWSTSVRCEFPVGTLLRLSVHEVYREGTLFLKARTTDDGQPVSLAEAQEFIRNNSKQC